MKAKDIALNGIFTALTIVVLYFASIIPTSTITILSIASCLIPISIMRGSIKSAIMVYIGSTIIALFLIPINLVIMYGLFFGVYGIIKYFIEKLRKIPLEVGLKLIFCNLSFILGLVLLKAIGGAVVFKLPFYLLFIAAQPIFLIYDYALTLIITFYLEKLHKHIK